MEVWIQKDYLTVKRTYKLLTPLLQLVRKCNLSFNALKLSNQINLVWKLGHTGMRGNEMVDHLGNSINGDLEKITQWT